MLAPGCHPPDDCMPHGPNSINGRLDGRASKQAASDMVLGL